MLTYSWNILSIKTEDVDAEHPQAVIHAKWRKTGVDEDGNEGRFDGACKFSLANVSPEDFIPFDQLTEEIVIGWVQDILNRGGMDRVDQTIQKVIDDNKTQTAETSLPWANNS